MSLDHPDNSNCSKYYQQAVAQLHEAIAERELQYPDWLRMSALTLIRSSLKSLHRSIDNPEEHSINWANPWVEAQYAIGWDWDAYLPPALGTDPSSDTFTETDTGTQEDIADKVELAGTTRNNMAVLHILTHGAALIKRNNTFGYLVPSPIRTLIQDLSEDDKDALLTRIYEPFIFNGADGQEQTIDLESRTCLMPDLSFQVDVRNKTYLGKITAQFHPLVVDEDTRRVYYPVVVGIVLAPETDDTPTDPSTWTEQDHQSLWFSIFNGIGSVIGYYKDPNLKYSDVICFSANVPSTEEAKPTVQPFFGVLADNAWIDTDVKSRLDTTILSRGLFTRYSKLKRLDDEIKALSRDILEQEGERAWREAGGRRDPKTGEPTLSPESPRIGELMVSLALRDKGFIRSVPGDPRRARFPREEACWLMKLSSGDYLGFSISWQNQAGPLFEDWKRDLENKLEKFKELNARAQQQLPLFEDEARLRQEYMDQITLSLALWRRGTQLLWLLHAASWSQGSNYVIVPDVQIAQAFWGGDRNRWPADYHRQIEAVLDHLRLLDFRNWTVTSDGKFNSRGAVWSAVSGYDPPYWKTPDPSTITMDEYLEEQIKKPEKLGPKACPPSCPLRNSGIRHGHYMIGLAPSFVGVLGAWQESKTSKHGIALAKGETAEEILYGWNSKRLDRNERKALEGDREYVKVDTMPGALLTAPWAELSSSQNRLLSCLLNELTLAHGRNAGAKAEIFNSETRIHIATNIDIPCELLEQGKEYVCFGGNGRYPASGYKIGGAQTLGLPGVRGGRKGGWLDKAGYEFKPGPDEKRKALRSFLKDLGTVMDLMGGVAAGYYKGRWLTLDEISNLATGTTLKDALAVNIRPFASADYTQRLEDYIREKGNFSIIPRTQAELDASFRKQVEEKGGITREDLKLEIKKRGIKQKDFALALDVTPGFLSLVLSGAKPFPEDLQKRAREILDKRVD